MSISITTISSTSPPFHHQGINDWIRSKSAVVNCCIHNSRVSKSNLDFDTAFSWTSRRRHRHRHYHHCSLNSDNGVHYTAYGTPDSQSYSPEQEDSVERENTPHEKSWSTTKVLEQLKRYGVSGILSYGLLNTAYYLTTFLTVWFYFAPAPGKMGYLSAVSRFLKVMAMVWAGSQVTKLFRAAGALALAPIVDKGLSWFTVKFKFDSRGKSSAFSPATS
ncbi:hypothetical protein RND81_04G182300 [Saponaria officinalis]|uniref:Uncharacterized protein n=1 Tax=Saponaria officinalis TaxID=3572 RepID=A0AAW1LNI1_SAPOF